MAELIPTATAEKKGLMDNNFFRLNNYFDVTTAKGNDICNLFILPQYSWGLLAITSGPAHIIDKLNTGIYFINNRCQGSDNLVGYKLAGRGSIPFYYKRNSDNSVNVYTKVQNEDYINLRYKFIIPSLNFTPVNIVDSSISESDLIRLSL